jgi:hypothetical protein
MDTYAAHELRLYIDNDEYRQRRLPIVDNLLKKKIKGTYDHTKSKKLWMYLVDEGAKKYWREFGGGPGTFPLDVRRAVASELADDFEWSLKAGDFANDLERLKPRGRARPAATRRKSPARKSGGVTKAQVEATFKSEVMPVLIEAESGGYPDKPGRREAWNNWIDGLQRDGTITEAQASSWDHPKWLETYKGKR